METVDPLATRLPSGVAAEGARPTVLIVDDDAVNRLLLCAWLGRTYDVVEACDGFEALDVLAATNPDVVILDVMMPGLDGIEVCRRIKARPDAGYLPVILLTALGEQESRNAGLEAGADDFLSKPVDQRELLLRLRSFTLIRQQDRLIREQVVALRRLDQLKEDLVSLVTHDLVNALSGILVMMEGIQYKGATPTDKELTTLLAATGRMRETLEDMLRIKQLEDGVLVLNRVTVPLTEIFEGAMTLVEPAARAKGVTIRPRVDPRALITGDAVLLRRSLFNLIQNAVKYSRRDDEVEVYGRVTASGAELEVHDRGPGVSDDIKEHLFEKWAGLGPRRERGPSGHGLGLFLVQLAAQAHGGEVTVSGREGGGTIFRLVIPA
ncbi:MAG: hybrid sensor histidine kinase/response regulator [Pseudomonadota bacterium]|nr:hybrid sensor histidine kinase/response regulator [Pseudomonadota bacterium]